MKIAWKEPTAKAISLSSITAKVKSNGVACRYQPKEVLHLQENI
jgi:hypothetical protein